MVNKVEKLIPNLRDKERYGLNHENMKQVLDLGLKFKKIHFESRFMKRLG